MKEFQDFTNAIISQLNSDYIIMNIVSKYSFSRNFILLLHMRCTHSSKQYSVSMSHWNILKKTVLFLLLRKMQRIIMLTLLSNSRTWPKIMGDKRFYLWMLVHGNLQTKTRFLNTLRSYMSQKELILFISGLTFQENRIYIL